MNNLISKRNFPLFCSSKQAFFLKRSYCFIGKPREGRERRERKNEKPKPETLRTSSEKPLDRMMNFTI